MTHPQKLVLRESDKINVIISIIESFQNYFVISFSKLTLIIIHFIDNDGIVSY